ncbi:MAG TPA: hypothetical protein VGX37_08615 [Allosphingosinicella sp.]|jgi:hypothetical protein|nr:hypothetical protein [Allosphingosinicella sp.]
MLGVPSLKSIGRALAAAAGLFAAAPASAQLFLYEPTFQSGPIEPNDPMVGIALPGATPAEYRAHLLWNLRAGLNVAALQCQFSPYLRAVDNYNAILAHHSRELAAAYQTLERYFGRVNGRTGPRLFDEYSTQTYNNFSTLQAQLGFCQTAGRIAKEALTRRKGELHLLAAARMRELRSSLVAAPDVFAFSRTPIRLSAINLTATCSDLPRRERRDCERASRGR